MNVLIAKIGATGDVVRTTPLLSKLSASVTWITAAKNLPLLAGIHPDLRALSWESRQQALDRRYDLIINLEDTIDIAEFLLEVECSRTFGALLDRRGHLVYTKDSSAWFDLSLISTHGKEAADQLKYMNRHTYQDLIFGGLGFTFQSETYLLPQPPASDLAGDVAIAAEAGPVWPMKNWPHYMELKIRLEEQGLHVNVLPKRGTLLEHLADVGNHRCIVGGDSLPMHLALGMKRQCVSLFNCTSPWEIHDYGLLSKIVSPLLGDYFYKRTFDPRATTAIGIEQVLATTLSRLNERAQRV